ncbi:MAG TPA: nitroreductase family deazaflavin-dependent oxidoreductase [Dehalococcoidia bacterium]|nr:nitroreductase family deazaflavin-dependent oxidoreductase [Dehalococcoidia bacterium]
MSEQSDINAINRQVIAQFRANGGNVLEGRFAGTKLLLLTTRGAKTGQTRVNPMMYFMSGDRHVVFASHRGAHTSPDWYHNLVAHPDVVVEVGGESFAAKAVLTKGEERESVWQDALRLHPFLADHQAGTKREIPVILLQRLT